MEYKKIEDLVVKLSKDPFNPEINFNCAVEYEMLNQTASAVSFYLRCAEFGYKTHKILAYNSLLKISRCLENQTDRQFNVSNYIYHALTVDAERPEAYFMAAEFHQKYGNWQESYTWSLIGLSKIEHEGLPVDIGYKGKYCLEFTKATSAWWIGRKNESKELFNNLLTQNIDVQYKKIIENNLKQF